MSPESPDSLLGQSDSPRTLAVLEVAKALYWTQTGREPTDEQALSEYGNRATVAVETMQRLGWHHGHSVSGDPTADVGIDIGQTWREAHTGDTFTVARTYRDHPANPAFLIEYDAPAQDCGKRIVTLAYFMARCERAA